MRVGKVRKRIHLLAGLASLASGLLCSNAWAQSKKADLKPKFQTSDRCIACHNGLTAPSGKDVSIGFDWRSTIMANSSRDPYWQASVRREDLEHPESKAKIEDECAACHMPIARYEAEVEGPPRRSFRSSALRTRCQEKCLPPRMAFRVPCAIRSEKKNLAPVRALTVASLSILRTAKMIIPSTVRIRF